MAIEKSKKLFGADPEVRFLAKEIDKTNAAVANTAECAYKVSDLFAAAGGLVSAKEGLTIGDVVEVFGVNPGSYFAGAGKVGETDIIVTNGYAYVKQLTNKYMVYVKFTLCYGYHCKNVLIATENGVATSVSATVQTADYADQFSAD